MLYLGLCCGGIWMSGVGGGSRFRLLLVLLLHFLLLVCVFVFLKFGFGRFRVMWGPKGRLQSNPGLFCFVVVFFVRFGFRRFRMFFGFRPHTNLTLPLFNNHIINKKL